MKELTKSEMINIFAEGIVDSFIKGNGKLSLEEAYLISDTITVLSVILQTSRDEELFRKFKESVE